MKAFQPASPPSARVVPGQYARLQPLDPASHGADLWNAIVGHDDLWRYMAHGPFANETVFREWLTSRADQRDMVTFAVVDRCDGRARGLLSLMEIRRAHGVIEVGHVLFAPGLRRTRVATETIYLLARWVFELGYRRLEWKCDNRNDASKRAAARFGFSPEGVFRQHMIVKGGNRDTTWFAMLDHEWPALRDRFEAWLAPSNFDAAGLQISSLAAIVD